MSKERGAWSAARSARACLTLIAAFGALAVGARPAWALAGGDGLIAVATQSGIETFDPTAATPTLTVVIPGAEDPAWSPQGTVLAYVMAGDSIWVAQADGSHATQVSLPGEYAADPAWSPDGRLSYYDKGHARVVIVDAGGSHRTVLPYGSWRRPAWTADGHLITVDNHTSLPPMLRQVIAHGDGSKPRTLTHPDGSNDEDASDGDGWQFASNGLVGFTVWEPADGYRVRFESYDGRYLQYPPSSFETTLFGRSDVALSPSGLYAAVYAAPQSVYPATVGIARIDLATSPAVTWSAGMPGATLPNAFTDISGGLDWQPRCTITGTPGDDTITGAPGVDVICSGAGNDTIRGKGGNDVIFAGPGNDTISGGWGNDVLVGGRGRDTVSGGHGQDLLNTESSDGGDTASGGRGADTCITDARDTTTNC